MIVNFGVCSDDVRVLSKNIAITRNGIDATPFEPMTVTRPTFILSYDDALVNCNYFEVPAFGRWYRVTGCSLQNGGRMVISGEVDVLKSFENQIKNLSVNVEKYQNEVEQFIPDTDYGITNAAITTVYNADWPFYDEDLSGFTVLGAIGKSSG